MSNYMPITWPTWMKWTNSQKSIILQNWKKIEIENKNRRITNEEAKTVKKNLPTSKISWPDGFIGEFYQKFREGITPILLKLFQKLQRKKTPKLILQGHHHSDTKTRQRCHKQTSKKNYRPISLVNRDAKILTKILANRIQQHIKKIIHHDKVDIIPGMKVFFGMCKSISVIHHINKLKDI